MNKQNFLIIAVISVFFAISIFAYQRQNAPLQKANQAIAAIDLRNFDKRAIVERSKTIEERIKDADLLFDESPIKAAGIYQDLIRQDPGRLDLHIRLGMLQLKNQQHDAAREHLHIVYEQKTAALQPDAAWFLGLLAIVEGDQDYAKNLLEESLNAGSQYQENAEQIYQLLN